MRILLTRAKADSERTAVHLAALGHASLISPVIEIVGFPVKLPAQKFDAIVATSAHAFAAVDVRELADAPLYVVGERTREAAERVDWIAPIRVGADVQELVELLRQDSARLRHVLYLAGRHRKPDIGAAAKEMSLDLDVVETYVAREAPSLTPEAEAALRTGEVDAVMHYSRRSAELFVTLADRAALWADAKKLLHFALSNDVAEPLSAAGVQPRVAARPDEDHLLALLAGADRG